MTYDPTASAASMCVRLWAELGELQMTGPQADADGQRRVTSSGVVCVGMGVSSAETPITARSDLLLGAQTTSYILYHNNNNNKLVRKESPPVAQNNSGHVKYVCYFYFIYNN